MLMDNNKQFSSDHQQNSSAQAPLRSEKPFGYTRIIQISGVIIITLIIFGIGIFLLSTNNKQSIYIKKNTQKPPISAQAPINTPHKAENKAETEGSIEIGAKAPVQILVTDPDGNKTGYDTTSSSVMTEIPHSEYFFDEAYSPSSTPLANTGVYWAIVRTPKKGTYQIDISGRANQSYGLTVYGTDKDTNTTFKLLEGELSPYGTEIYKVQYSPDATENIVVNKRIR